MITDLDRRRFIRGVSSTIQQLFEVLLAELSRQNPGAVEADVMPVDATKFTAEVFVSGKSRARCKVWIGGLTGGNEISYAEGSTSQHSNSVNEALSPTERGGELALHALMGTFGGRAADGLDLKKLSADDTANYLWRRFLSDLEH